MLFYFMNFVEAVGGACRHGNANAFVFILGQADANQGNANQGDANQ
jgi:hypothetical protein